jgi:YD repeat-containing protein
MKIVYRYDALDRLVEAMWEDGHRETYTYDAAGNRLAVNPAAQSEPMENSLAASAASPAPGSPAPAPAQSLQPTVEQKSNRNRMIAIVVIVVLLCFCLPALLGILYFVARNAGVLPAWLGGTTWVPLILLHI